MYKVVEVDDGEAVVKVPGANAKASQEGTFDDASRSKQTVAVAVAALITELLLVEKDFIM
jgi:hypothetical protein